MNLLLTSRTNPRLSAYAQIFGTFDFNATPMSLPGTKIIAQEKPNQRAKWSKHGVQGWYIGPSFEHYSCYKLFFTVTRSERIADVVDFFPQDMIMPRVLSYDAYLLSAQDLVESLQNPMPNSMFTTINDTHHALLRSMQQLLNIIPKFAEQQYTKRHNGRDGKRWHIFTKYIRINGPSAAHYTSIHGQYNSRWNFQQCNQATAIMYNEYGFFLDLWPKKLKSFLLYGDQNKTILQTISQNMTLKSILNVYVLSIYRQIIRQINFLLYYLSRICKGPSRRFQYGRILQDVTHSPNITTQQIWIQDMDHKYTGPQKDTERKTKVYSHNQVISC